MVRSRDEQKDRDRNDPPQRNPHRLFPRKSQDFRKDPSCKEPRNANLLTYMAWDANNLKDRETLKKYGTGFRFAWNVTKARKVFEKAGFRAPGRYKKTNQTKGKIFTLPREVPTEARFGEEQAGMVMRHVLKSKPTRSQAENVSKVLSYIRQLQTGDDKVNFRRVRQVWNHHDAKEFAEPTQRVKAVFIVAPEQMKTCLTNEYTQATRKKWIYAHWCLAYNLFYHWNGLGLRPKEDFMKVKKSTDHVCCPSHGFMYTQFVGGRAKLDGTKAVQPWRAYSVCLCPGAKHQGVPENFMDVLIDGKEPTWCTTCPLTCFEVIRSHLDQDDPRVFPSPTITGFAAFKGKEYKSIGPRRMFTFVQKFIDDQGANPDNVTFDTNQGRHALGKVCDVAGIPYEQSFEIHGDQYKNWKVYQERLKNDKNFDRRSQSTDLDVVLKPLWRLARWFGRGRTEREDPAVVSMEKLTKLMIMFGRKAGFGSEVNRILDED